MCICQTVRSNSVRLIHLWESKFGRMLARSSTNNSCHIHRFCPYPTNTPPPHPPPPIPLFLTDNIKSIWMEYQAKINEKYRPVLQCISSFEGTSYKKLQDIAITSFISCCFTSVFTSADINFTTFQNLIQNYLQKYIFLTESPDP